MKRTIIAIILVVVLCSMAYSESYERLGGNDGDYQVETLGIFNSALEEDDYNFEYPITVSTFKFTPLVSDLDGNGVNEIIILDNNSLEFYNYTTRLLAVDSISLPTDERTSPPYIFDIDGDGLKEIMVHQAETERMLIYEYNGSLTRLQKNFTTDSLTTTEGFEGDSIIACETTNRCVLIYAQSDNSFGAGTRDYMFAHGFTQSGLSGNEVEISKTSSSNNHVYCFPMIPSVQKADYNNGGNDWLIWGYMDLAVGTTENHLAGMVRLNSSGGVSHNNSITFTDSYELEAGGGTEIVCNEDNAGRWFTNVLAMNIDGATSNGMELLMGRMKDSDEFKIYAMKADESYYDKYPSVQDADGIILSNIFRANAFPDTGGSTTADDFCVVGYNARFAGAGEQHLDIHCGVAGSSGKSVDNVEFNYELTGLYNMTSAFHEMRVIAHSVQTESTLTEGANLHEIVTPYGVFSLDWENIVLGVNVCGNGGQCYANRIFENPITDAGLIPADVQDNNRFDLLAFSNTTLYYINDEYVNSNAWIYNWSTNPCHSDVIKVNESMRIKLECRDVDGDNVSGRAILYSGDDNEQDDGWTTNQSSGSEFIFLYEVNKTISSGVIRVYCRDDNAGVNVTESASFAVGLEGVTFGSCLSVHDNSGDVTVGTNISADGTDLSDNFIDNALDSAGQLGLGGVSKNILWLLLMAFLAYAIWKSGHQHPRMAFGMVMMTEAILIVIGAKLEYLSTALVFIMAVVSIAILALVFREKLTGG